MNDSEWFHSSSRSAFLYILLKLLSFLRFQKYGRQLCSSLSSSGEQNVMEKDTLTARCLERDKQQ